MELETKLDVCLLLLENEKNMSYKWGCYRWPDWTRIFCWL